MEHTNKERVRSEFGEGLMVFLTLPESFAYLLNNGKFSKDDLLRLMPHGPNGIRTPLFALERLLLLACGDNANASRLDGPFWNERKNSCYVLLWVTDTIDALAAVSRELKHFGPLRASYATYDWGTGKWIDTATGKPAYHQPFWELPK